MTVSQEIENRKYFPDNPAAPHIMKIKYLYNINIYL